MQAGSAWPGCLPLLCTVPCCQRVRGGAVKGAEQAARTALLVGIIDPKPATGTQHVRTHGSKELPSPCSGGNYKVCETPGSGGGLALRQGTGQAGGFVTQHHKGFCCSALPCAEPAFREHRHDPPTTKDGQQHPIPPLTTPLVSSLRGGMGRRGGSEAA